MTFFNQEPTVNEDVSVMQDSNTATVEIVQESTTPDNASRSSSQHDKLADTGEVNMIVINPLNETSSDFSVIGSKSSGSMETQKFMTVIEENTEMTENDQKSSLSQDLTAKIKEASRRSADTEDDSDDSDADTIDRIEVDEKVGNELVKEVDNGDEDGKETDKVESLHDETDDEKDEAVHKKMNDMKQSVEIQSTERFEEIQELIQKEIGYYEAVDKSFEEEMADKEQSIKEDAEKSLSEGKGLRSTELLVLDRNSAPKVMLEYEPSTTEAESGMSDSDTLDTESLHEDFVNMVKRKKGKVQSLKNELVPGTQGGGSISSDKEVAIAMATDSPSTIEKQQIIVGNDDIHRGSTEPITQDTMGDGESLVDEDGEEVITCAVSHHKTHIP